MFHRSFTCLSSLLALVAVMVVGCGQQKSDEKSGTAASETSGTQSSSPKNPITTAPPDRSWTNGMIFIPSGTFMMGNTNGQTDEIPVHQVTIDSFWMDKTEVSNDEFEKFVKATGYITVAERKPDPKDFPGVPEENLVAGAIVFSPPSLDELNAARKEDGLDPVTEFPLDNHSVWWKYVAGANWRHPQGPKSSIAGLEKHPVVQVCWDDAMAYATWAGKRLPTEAEWEYAARGGLTNAAFVWGNEMTPGGKWRGNIWQGKFPTENTSADGFPGTAPVASFAPNGYGLYDMAGNVWEWCADWYHPEYYSQSPAKNPPGPEDSYDPNEPGVMKRVMRGGSFLCSDVYCTGYRPSARMKSSPDTALSHTGFRCVRN